MNQKKSQQIKANVKAFGLYQKYVCWTKESGKDNYYLRINFLLRLQNSHQHLPSQISAAVQVTQVSLLSYSPCLSPYHLMYTPQNYSHPSLDFVYIRNTWLLQVCLCGILTKGLWCFTDSKLPSLSILPSCARTECVHNLSQHNCTIDNSYCTPAQHQSTSISHDCMSDLFLCSNTIKILLKPPPSKNGRRFCFLKPTFQPPVHSKYSWYNQTSQNPIIFCLLANCFLEQFSSLTCEPLLSSVSPLACLFSWNSLSPPLFHQ